MSKGPLLLWLVMELGCLYPTSAVSEVMVTGFLGYSVTLPCEHLSWSQSSNSMCWGKGQCPNSKCGQELIQADRTGVISRKSARYSLEGNVQRGDVSLTISATREDDSGVYCCRIEVPGWFNDVKKNIRLVLRRAPTTTSHPTTSSQGTTTAVELPTTVLATPDLTTTTPLQTMATSVLTAAATTCPLTTPSSLSEAAPGPLTTETITEGPVLTKESETSVGSSDSRRSTEVTLADLALLTSKGTTAGVFTSPPQVMVGKTNGPGTSQPVEQTDQHPPLLIIASCLGSVLLLALLLAFILRGKVTKTNCLQKHKRLDDTEESKTVASDLEHGRSDENGLFALQLVTFS